MKKMIMTLALALCSCLWTMAETVDEFVNTMKNDTTVEYVELTPDMLKLMIAQQGVPKDADAKKAIDILEKVTHIEMLTGSLLADSAPLKARLAALTVDGLDEMVNTNEEGELTRVWLQTDGQNCKMILVVNADEGDHDWQVVKLHCDIVMDGDFNLNNLMHLD